MHVQSPTGVADESLSFTRDIGISTARLRERLKETILVAAESMGCTTEERTAQLEKLQNVLSKFDCRDKLSPDREVVAQDIAEAINRRYANVAARLTEAEEKVGSKFAEHALTASGREDVAIKVRSAGLFLQSMNRLSEWMRIVDDISVVDNDVPRPGLQPAHERFQLRIDRCERYGGFVFVNGTMTIPKGLAIVDGLYAGGLTHRRAGGLQSSQFPALHFNQALLNDADVVRIATQDTNIPVELKLPAEQRRIPGEALGTFVPLNDASVGEIALFMTLSFCADFCASRKSADLRQEFDGNNRVWQNPGQLDGSPFFDCTIKDRSGKAIELRRTGQICLL